MERESAAQAMERKRAEEEELRKKKEEEEKAAEQRKQQDRARPVTSTPVPGKYSPRYTLYSCRL